VKQYMIFDGGSIFIETPNFEHWIYCADSLNEAKDIAPEFGDCICYSYDEKGVSLDDAELINEKWEFTIINGQMEAENGKDTLA